MRMRTGLDRHSCALPKGPGFTKGNVAPADLRGGVNSAAGWLEGLLGERMNSVVIAGG